MKKNSTFGLLSKMTLRTIKNSWAQFLAIIAIGAIAVTLFVGLLANAQAFENQVYTAYNGGNLASLWVTTSTSDTKDYDQVEAITKEVYGDDYMMDSRMYIPASANGTSIYLAVVHQQPTVCKPYEEVTNMEGYGSDQFVYLDKELEATGASDRNDSFVLGGSVTFDIDISSNYTSVTKNFLEQLDDYVISGGKNIFKADKISLTSTITGFMSYPENVTKSTYNSSVVLVSDRMFREMVVNKIKENYGEENLEMVYSIIALGLNFNSLDDTYITNPNQYLIRVEDESKLTTLKEKLESYYSSKQQNNLYLITKRESMPFYITLNNDVTQARQFTFIFPFVFFLVAVLVILTTLSQMVLKERKEIGTLKAIGLSKFQIYLHYVSLTLTLVFLGVLIGEILGPIIIPAILGNKYLLIYSLPTRQYYFPVLYGLLTAFVFLFISGLVTFLICRKEVNLKPAESMRPAVSKMKFKTNTIGKKEKVLKVSAKMALRNILSNKAKSLMVIIGVMGCTALLACGFGIEDTVNYGIDHDMKEFFNSDIAVTYAGGRDYEAAKDDIYTIEGVEKVEPFVTTTTSMRIPDGNQANGSLYIIAPQDQNPHFKVDFPTSDSNAGDGLKYVVISQKIARKLNATAGDTITFSYENVNYDAKIYEVYEAFFYHGIIVHSDFFPETTDIVYTNASVTLKEGADVNAIQEKINSYSYVSSSKNQVQWTANINDVMSGVFVMTNAVKVFAILLAIVVLYNLSLMNFKERTRDIATLKVLGFNRIEIAMSLLLETMILTGVGVVFGLCLGYPFLLAVMGTNIVELVEYLYTITFLSYFFAFLLTYVLALAVNLFFTTRTNKIKMVESLKSVE